MYAIVLTYDRQIVCAELLYKKYMKLWNNCPLTFRIPYNSPRSDSYKYFKSKSNVELVETESSIRETMCGLLNGIDDDEWVYWCMDDRYPYEISSVDALNSVYEFVKKDKLPKHLYKKKEGVGMNLCAGRSMNNFDNGIATPIRIDRIKTRGTCQRINYDELKKCWMATGEADVRFGHAPISNVAGARPIKKLWQFAHVGGFLYIQERMEVFHEVSCHQFVRAGFLKWYFLRNYSVIMTS